MGKLVSHGQVLDLLSAIWTQFDDFCGELNLYKVACLPRGPLFFGRAAVAAVCENLSACVWM